MRALFEAVRKERLPGDVLQLSQAAKRVSFSRTSLRDMNSSRVTPQKRALVLEKANEVMDAWVYAVIVSCRLYVWIVCSGAAVLVAGGLAIGLTLQDRLKSVDPFNMTVYTWALAAFLILICKAVMVENWAWQDFLRSAVKCRSLTELHAITSISEQLIIAKLLHDEQDSVLQTSGPYNAVFRRKVEGGASGFSIDVPVNNKTLLLSGLSMLKVETAFGHALVCLDSRKGTDLSVVQHRRVRKDEVELACSSIDRIVKAASKNGEQGSPLRSPLRPTKLDWRRVEGVYNNLQATFN
ncbi:hypothetical protein N3K66_005897 [Trichothecium roseum]|uniref:Uncharacterized protein n=1 Tax=Trichothecium roseum TaxID=47278 RepID=A0ACC0UZA9_9HYPO|nr:hypothetical protein N3K66_005897 [Trichothecium roseum]